MDKQFTPEMITPQWVAILLVAGLLIVSGPRKWVLPTLLVVTAILSTNNRVYVFGLNFFSARIVLLLAWVRVLARGEHHGLLPLPMDKALVLFCCWSVVTETLQRGIPGTVYGVANYLYDALGTYFLARILLQDATPQVLQHLLKILGLICCLFAVFMMAEFLTGRNWLTPLGATFESVQAREGRLRCQATFQHPVLAGTYGGVLLLIFAACWWQPRMKTLAIAGCVAATLMVLTAGSGGPLMTYAAVVGCLFLWPLRHRMRSIRWGVLLTLIALHLVMKAPVWAIISRIQVVPGASGYHRYVIIDAFIEHIREWWLIGVQDTSSWGWFTEDVANYFCIVAKHAGLLGLVLFVRILVVGFREVGLRRQAVEGNWPTEIMVWAFGASLFGHAVSFFGTSYFDQTIFLWHFTLAMLASLSLLTESHVSVAETEAVKATGSDGEIPIGKPLPAN